MPKYVIERELVGLGKMTPDELEAVARKSNEVLDGMAPTVQWQHSYVTDDKMFCVYVADGPELVREHAACGGFPADAIRRVSTVIDPVTGGK